MNHPNLHDLKELTDPQLEAKIAKLSSVYFMTQDENVRHQIILLLDTFKIEQETRRAAAKKKQEENRSDDDKGLDSLINIS